MTIEQLQSVYKAKPFNPFTLHLADGGKLYVPHADFISHSPKGRTLIIYGEGEAFSIVDLLLVTRLEIHNGSTADLGNQN